jgi:hypothetical protein
VDRLAQLTRIPENPVRAFLRAQRGMLPTVEHRQARSERFKEAYAYLLAAGKPLSAFALARRVHANRKAAAAFLAAYQHEGKSVTSLART